MNPQAEFTSPNVFSAAVEWLNAVLLGSLASLVAIIAVGSVGFLLLSGRVDVRRAAQVILGCFILFGASAIASGIMRGLTGGAPTAEILPPPVPPALPPVTASHATMPNSVFDPYAGAALPQRR